MWLPSRQARIMHDLFALSRSSITLFYYIYIIHNTYYVAKIYGCKGTVKVLYKILINK